LREAADEGVGGTIGSIGGKLKDLAGAEGTDAVKKAAEDAAGALTKAKPGKRFTSARGAAIKELETIRKNPPENQLLGDLEQSRAALRAKAHDSLEILGKLDRVTDPTKAMFADLSAKSLDELERLIRISEAANDTHLRQVLKQFGSPPKFGRPLVSGGIAVFEEMGKYQGVEFVKAKDRKGGKLVCAVSHNNYGTTAIISGPYQIHQELTKRRNASKDDATRNRVKELLNYSDTVYQRGRVGESLTTWHGTYLERKAAGNEKGADDVRKMFLDRFYKELDEKMRAAPMK